MNDEISASFTFESNSFSPSLTLGRGKNSDISVTKKFDSVKMAFKTLGGSSSAGSFSIPTEVGQSSIDLSSWLSSTDYPANHVVADFEGNGLIPLQDFIVEQNLKDMVNKYCHTNEIPNEQLREPIIRIVTVAVNQLFLDNMYLETRFGDRIILSQYAVARNEYVDFTKYDQWVEDFRKIFPVKVVYESIINNFRSNVSHNIGDYANLLDHKDNYKLISDQGILYLIDEVDKVGFSIPNNRQVMNEYGLVPYINGLIKSDVTLDELIEKDYIINAL